MVGSMKERENQVDRAGEKLRSASILSMMCSMMLFNTMLK
jgi:hypothetical protein